MRVMSWEEIEQDWGGLQKKQRMEIAQAVAKYCIGHKMAEVAERLGYSPQWVVTQLDYAGIGTALGPNNLDLKGSTDNVAKEVPRLVKEYGPSIKTEIVGQGGAGIKIEGDDAEAFQPYFDHYIEQGHEPAAASRLAKAEWAAEAAVEAGVIKEDVNKKKEKVNRILFPDDQKATFGLNLRTHIANVRRAAKFLDESKITYLKDKRTCEMVASAHEKWLEQVERVLNLNPNHLKGV